MLRFSVHLLGVILSIALGQKALADNNPLLEKWSGPYGGVPVFDKFSTADFKPAILEAMKQKHADIDKIATSTEPPTFENTIVAMEKAGELMTRVMPMYGVWEANLNTPEFRQIQQEMAPKLAAFEDEIVQNRKLFERIEAVYTTKPKLSAEQSRLLWYQYNYFVLRGARLDAAAKKRLMAINERLATLSTQFSQNVLSDEENEKMVLTRREELAGLPQDLIDGAQAEAAHRGLKGWVIANTRSAVEPFLTYSTVRPLREKAFRMWVSRGEKTNNPLVTEILKLRGERSRLLGYATYAHWHLADTMAKQPQAAMDLMMRVWTPAVARVKEEVRDMQAIVDSEKGHFKIQPWDYRFYAEKVRSAKYDLDLDTVKPYLQLENIREAMFWAAGKLYGYKFDQVHDVPVFHADVRVYKVSNAAGKQIGVWYFDPYARAGKNSGAWMTAYREQQQLDGEAVTTIVSNNSNFIKGRPGEPVLISWIDAVTMFHEFGHALHGLSSAVTYPTLSGTNTARDFVEFPSQVNENFLATPEVLRFLTDQNGNPFPKELIAKIDRAKTFNQGFTTVEFLASAIVDLKLHLADKPVDAKKFEKTTLRDLGMPAEIVMRHRIPQFNHIFSSEGYAAGYYGYLWAQVLDHDAFEAFTEAGNPYDEQVAKKLHDEVLAVGNTVDPAEAYRNFRGRDPQVEALLRARGFPVPVMQVGN